MLTTVWSVKGGVGVSVVSAALAVVRARATGSALLVDLAGDQPALLGLPEPSGPGVWDWLESDAGTARTLERLVVAVAPDLDLLPAGRGWDVPPARRAALVDALAGAGRSVVVDAGMLRPSAGEAGPVADGGPCRVALGRALAEAGRSLLVTRPCYLALRRAAREEVRADAVVLVVDPGRALDRRDVAQVLGLPVAAVLEVDPAVARSVDAGTLVTRLPRSVERALRGVS